MTDHEHNEDSSDASEATVVVRDRGAHQHVARRRHFFAVAGAVVVAMVVIVLWAPWSSPPAHSTSVRQVTTSVAPTTTIAVEEPVVAPLTGRAVAADRAVGLLRPALVAKIDGASQAMPQEGLDAADMVIEVRVEGISRYLAVWHSNDVESIGPVRSARTTDPDLLAVFGRPLFAYSGGNTGVLADLRRSDWFIDVSHDGLPEPYRRERDRRAPHNLFANASELVREGMAREPDEAPVMPLPVFTYRSETDDSNPPPGQPSAGMSVSVGSDARFEWDPQRAGWLRWAYGREHLGTDGRQLAPTNVVVLEVEYVRSAADLASPEAVSVGTGRAWVYSSGSVQQGRWDRPQREDAWQLSGDDGGELTLAPGATWVVLSDGAPTG